MTEILRVDALRPDRDDIARAAEQLRAGGLVAFPTETVYGLGAHALDPDAIRRLFEAKGRPANDPLIVHVAELDGVRELVADVPDAASILASRFWPGPLTLVMRRSTIVPDEVTAGLATVAVRVPAHTVARALLEAARLPIAAPSANLFSRPSPTEASHVLQDLDGRIDMIIDGGSTTVGLESTVLDLTSDPATILRPGAVSAEELRRLIPRVRLRANAVQGAAMPSPGLLSKHYAPRAPLTLVPSSGALMRAAREGLAHGLRVGILATAEDARALREIPVVIAELGPEHNVERIASRLYGALRELDEQNVNVIFARDVVQHEGLWLAVRDRLHRAASR